MEWQVTYGRDLPYALTSATGGPTLRVSTAPPHPTHHLQSLPPRRCTPAPRPDSPPPARDASSPATACASATACETPSSSAASARPPSHLLPPDSSPRADRFSGRTAHASHHSIE